MKFNFDSSGTAQQVQWVKDAIAACGYDLSLLAYTVNVVWADPIPKGDSGKLHAYMVTNGSGSNWTITIEKWADDPTNPNNQGLPDPSNDIYTFYKQAFVHELGHVVSESLLTTTDLIGQACSLFWTPEMNGGSGMRYGTADDWDPANTPWAELIIEAIAEQFKIVYYGGALIFRNRTIWRLPVKNWPALWKLLMPPFKTLWSNTGSEGGLAGGSETIRSNGDPGGVQYLSNDATPDGYAALAMFSFGPVTQPGGTPAAPNNPGGTWGWTLAIIVFNPDNPGVTDTFASLTMGGAINLANEPYPEGAPYNWAKVSCNVFPNINLLSNADASSAAQVCEIGVKATGVPNDYQVDFITGDGLIASGVVTIPEGHNALAVTFTGGQSVPPTGYADMQAGELAWIESAAFAPPPYPAFTDGGDIAVGQGYRGAVILGK